MSKENENVIVDNHDEEVIAATNDVEQEEESYMSENKKSVRTIGTKLTKKGATTEENLVVGHLTSVGEIGIESEEMDVTTHDSVDDFKEYEAGSKDAGEVSIAGLLKSPDNFEKLLVLANSREVCDWEVDYPSGHKWTFKAFVKSLKDNEKTVDGLAGFTATLRISGAPTFTKGV